MDSCIFCRIVAGEAPAQVVYEDDELFAFKDRNPAAPVHMLIIPRRHIASLADATPEDAALLGKMALLASELARQLGVAESGFRLVTNTGRDGGQSVFHLHWHLLGGRHLRWPPG